MKSLCDYVFFNSWLLDELKLSVGEQYQALEDIGQVKKGNIVKFEGFADIDNHYGILVFTHQDEILEISGDYAGREHSATKQAKACLSKQSGTSRLPITSLDL